MAKDGDDKGLDEHTRIGVAPPKLPGAPKPPAESPPPAPPQPPAAAPPALDEHTRLGVAPPKLPGTPPPAAPQPPPSAAPLDESTRLAATPPPTPKAPAAPAPPAAPAQPAAPTTRPAAPAPPPAGGGSDFTEHTILLSDLQKEFVPPARLQRMAPPGRSDIINLDRTHYLMGRLPSCDLRLYSQTASREHAELNVRDGRWYLTPVAGKAVLVNGTQVKEEVPLRHKMRLVLGGDELLFLDESGATAIEEAPRGGVATATAAAASNRWLALVIALVALALVLWMWATR
jgi:hypothetical protein